MKGNKVKFLTGLCAALVIGSVLFLILFIFVKGIPVVSWSFLTENPSSFGSADRGGIYPAIIGTLALAAIAGVTGTFLGFFVALDQVFYRKSKKMEQIVSVVIRTIAAIPSIVMGLFGYTFFVKNLGTGRSLLAGGLTLGLMIFPYLEIRFEKMMGEVPEELIHSALALGVSRKYIVFQLVFPMIREDFFRSIAHQTGFAMGATAPIILTAAVLSAPAPQSLFDPVMALPFHLYILINEGLDPEGAYGTAFVLLALLLFIHLIALLLSKKGGADND